MENIHIPKKIIRHRPDIIGYNYQTGDICIGEAKTSRDIGTSRTREQIVDYSLTFNEKNGRPSEIIIGILYNDIDKAKLLLHGLGLDQVKHIHIVWIPEELINAS